MARKSEYHIGFTGLSDGKHCFSFKIGKTFFDQLEYSEIQNASLTVNLELEKKPTMMIAVFDIEGKINVMCDRCTDYFDLPVKGSFELIYKFGEEDLDDENVVTVYPSDTEIDVTHPIYEFAILLLPVKRIHPEGQCNAEMIEDIDKYLMIEAEPKQEEKPNEEDEIDPRWAALKDLKKNINKNKN